MLRTARKYCFLLAFLLASGSAQALDPPVVHSRITDLAGVLSGSDISSIEQTLAGYERATSNQFVVVVVPSLGGESIEDFSLRVAEVNKIGQKGQDNGLLLLVSVQDRKMRFEVGYGLEDKLTDALTSTIIRDIIAPEFKKQNYAAGISAGMKAAMQVVTGEFQAPPEKKSPRRSKGGPMGIIVLIIVFLIVRTIIRRKGGGGFWFIGFPPFGGGSSWGGGGSWGGGSGGGFGGFSGGGGSFGGGGSSGGW